MLISKSVVIFGETRLTISCIEHLLSNAWGIEAVITRDIYVISWCKERLIKCLNIEQIYELAENLGNCYVFSVVNPYILSTKLLASLKPIKAINYHNSLLPKYAGVNSTTWALLSIEPFHGITWHEMVDGIDEGDIYYQAKFTIDESDTAFSLNLKCTDAALTGFTTLIKDIEQNKLIGIKQNLSQKTYFGREYVPINYAYLTPFNSESYINNLLNSLSFGDGYINPVATIKIKINDISYILERKLPQENISILDPSSCILRNIYGKKVNRNFAFAQIEPCVLSETNISNCKKLKKKELSIYNNLYDLLSESEAQSGLLSFGEMHGDKEEIKLDIKISVDKLSLFLSIILSRLSSNNTFIKVYHKSINDSGALIRAITENISILAINQDNLSLQYHEMVKKIHNENDNQRLHVFKDFGYRYNLDLCSEFAITNNYSEAIDDHSVVFVGNQNKIVVRFYRKDTDFIKMLIKTICMLLTEYENAEKSNGQIKKLPLLSQEDYQKVIYDWNATAKEYSDDKTIHQLFEEQVAKTPNNIAVIYENIKLTYKELNEKTNQLANYLRETYKIKGDDLIALCLDRSEYMLIAILGILKSGAAYVPIDPDFPSERIAYILEDTQSKVIITTIYSWVSENPCTDIITIDNNAFIEVLKKYSKSNLNTNITSENLAYVIYTSGTTGNPKGVMLQHKGIVNRIEWMNDEYPLTEQDKVLQKTPYIFDVSIWELFWANWYGATIVFAKSNGHKDSEYLMKLLTQREISIIHFVPSMLGVFIQNIQTMFGENGTGLDILRYIFCSGENLPLSYVKDIHKLLPTAKVYNLYGPTETSIDVLSYDCNRKNIRDIYIGKPIANTTCYILDNNLNPVPIGSIGELYIGGAGLAREYLNLPELTKKCFLANPFQTKPQKQSNTNTRIYKTGDLVYMLPDGNIEYIGRNDLQVKIRGFRVELGEIEAQLVALPEIKQSIVLVHKHFEAKGSVTDNQYLVAYYVAEAKLDEMVILDYLSSKLPDYMLPSILIYLDKLPLTINGKLNYKAFPRPEYISKITYLAPRNELEIKVCNVFAQVLKLEESKVGIHDNFFQLGGNSILAINLVSKLNNLFHSSVKVIDLYTHNTIENIADLVKSTLGKFAYEKYLIKNSNTVDLYQPFDLNNVQQAYYFGRLDEFELGNISSHIYSELIFNELDLLRLEKAINILISRHLELRTIFINGQQQYLEHTTKYKLLLHEFINEKELHDIRDELSHKVYKADQFPLFDFIISRYNNCYILHISVDALLMDGNSYQILFNELGILYNNPKSELPLLNVTYRDYITQLVQVRNSNLFDSAKVYWFNKLNDYNFAMNLPLKCQAIQIEKPIFNRVSAVIEKNIWHRIENKAKKYGISSTALILCIYGKILSYWTNQDKLCINLTLFNRLPLHMQINDIIGDFTSLELFNYQDQKELTILAKLQHTHKELWNDIEYNLFDGIDFQRLIRKKLQLPSNQIIAPIVLTSMLGNNTMFGNTKLINDSYQGVNYSITQTSQLWLDNKAYETKDGFIAEWDYVDQLFERPVIEAMHMHYCHLIKYLANADWNGEFPCLKVPNSNLELINNANYVSQPLTHDTLFGFYEKHIKINQLLKNIAVIENLGAGLICEYSYVKLLDESELFAKYICNLDIFYHLPSQLIAILSEKGYNQLIASIAIMKSACAYLPLHIDWPLDRIEEVLAQGKVAIVLISKEQASIIETSKQLLNKYRFLIIEDILEKIAKDRQQSNSLEKIFLPHVKADDVAYVIFTSGSTGIPKGVTISHRGALNTISAVNEKFQVTEKDKVLALSELSFDLSVYDIFGLLAVGGTIVFPNQNDTKKPNNWINLINKYKITIWNSVPQLASLLIDGLDVNKLTIESLRLFLLSGDWIPTNLPILISQVCSTSKIVSLGGATEGSIWSIWHEITEIDNTWTKIPYGIPMPNQKMYILNNNLKHNPIGVIGEIYIGGVGVALNYWGNENATKESFILHSELGRIYKTGDLGCWHKDGYIEFMGRDDSQVKLNGFRVELEEIENKIVNYSEIKQAAVILKENNKKTMDNKYIVVYYVSIKKLDETLLLHYLAKQLPEYMIPHVFVHLNELPLTKNGKLDKNALPEANFINISAYVAPRNDLERQVCEIYAEVLGIAPEEIGIADDFFKFGGNSILAIKLVNKLSTSLGMHIAIVTLFKYKTITAILEHIKGNIVEAITIPKAPISDKSCYPLSFAQERLWFIEEYENGINAYNIPVIAEINQGIDLEILKCAINSIVSRHEILHSLVKINDFGHGYQVVENLAGKPLIFNEHTIATDTELKALINQSVNHIYKLNEEYPIKVAIFSRKTTKSEKHYICIVVHHIAFDGWSVDIFLNEMERYYNYYSKLKFGESLFLDLPELSIQYKDFAIWQRSYLVGDLLDEQINYWLSKLNGYEILNLPIDNPRPLQISYIGDNVSFALTRKTSKKIRTLAKSLDVSLYSVLLSGYYILLSSYSNQDDIVVGIPVTNRHYHQLEHMIGFFVNSLAFRSRISKSNSLVSYIMEINKQIIEAQSYQDLPFEKLVTELNVANDISRHPIFQVMFTVQNFGRSITHKNPLFKPYKGNEYKVAKFDITTFIDDGHEKLSGVFNYATSLFNQDTISRLINTYMYILEQIAELNLNSQMLVNDLRFLTKEDYKKVIYKWNETTREYPRDKTIHQLFEEQVLKTPNNIAVIYKDTKLTYKELNASSNRLASYLRATYQIQGDDLVALCIDRNENMLIAIIAILKSGAAYVPIDPSSPYKRINFILNDINAKILVTDSKCYLNTIINYRERYNKFPNILIIDHNKFMQVLKKYSISNLELNINSSSLAYVIYTSGTTGKPKGVMIEHKSVINTIFSIKKIYYVQKNCKVSFFTSYIFDVSVSEIFTSLISGCELHILSEEIKRNPDAISDYLISNKITVCYLPPAILSLIRKQYYPDLVNLIYAGEPCNYETGKYWSEHKKLYNYYGPTEASIYCLGKRIINGDVGLIGKPLDNTTSYVLDANLNPLPIGGIGELYIGGAGLARSYLNHPELTAEKFLLNPFQIPSEVQSNLNAKIYKTGDLVRMLPDGNIQYMGRNDSQVKISGFRVELGEVESLLNSYDGIKHSIVIIKEHVDVAGIPTGNKYLVAYYVAGKKLDERAILTYLERILPEYLIPNIVIWLEEPPLTSSGKLDKSVLYNLEVIYIDTYVAPRNAAEIKTCAIYSEILNLPSDQIGINHDFFKLGGNSIMAINLLYKLQKEFKISLNDIFKLRIPARIAKLEPSTKINLYHKLIQMKPVYDKLSSYKTTSEMQRKKALYLQDVKQISFTNKLKCFQNILLTGATGHLGCHILYQLLHKTNYKIYLLIRAASNVEAYHRINTKFKYYFDVGLENYRSRIIASAADIEKPDLNISYEHYQELIANVDSIIHSAALVKHYGDYITFYQANVQATINLLELAKRTQLKDFHYISTLSVLANCQLPNYHYQIWTEEDSQIGFENSINNVYVKTKYEAELAIIKYRECGVNCNIYRMGNLAMNSKNHRNQENIKENAFFIQIRTILDIGMIPKEISNVEISPVDSAALAIIKLFDQVELSNKIYHVSNPHPCDLSDLFAQCNKVRVKSVAFEEFIEAVLMQLNNGANRELIERFVLHQMWLEEIKLENITKIVILQNKTDAILGALDFYWPEIKTKMISGIINQHFKGIENEV